MTSTSYYIHIYFCFLHISDELIVSISPVMSYTYSISLIFKSMLIAFSSTLTNHFLFFVFFFSPSLQASKKFIAPNAIKNVRARCYVLPISISTRPAFSAANVRSHQPPVVSLPKMVLTIVYQTISVCMERSVLPVRNMSRAKWSQQWVKPITKSVSHVPNANSPSSRAVR